MFRLFILTCEGEIDMNDTLFVGTIFVDVFRFFSFYQKCFSVHTDKDVNECDAILLNLGKYMLELGVKFEKQHYLQSNDAKYQEMNKEILDIEWIILKRINNILISGNHSKHTANKICIVFEKLLSYFTLHTASIDLSIFCLNVINVNLIVIILKFNNIATKENVMYDDNG